MPIIKEFKEFAVKGNAVDMAVGLVIGAAFSNVVNSIVNDIIMPPIGYAIGGVDFGNLAIVLKEAVGDTPAVAIRYGAFINKVINFLVVAFSMFMVVKFMNHLTKFAPAVSKKGKEKEGA
jgi:large conductance mechanosensitive channel